MAEFKLRPYQSGAIEGARVSFRKGARSTLITMPTGTGKTVVETSIAAGVVQRGRNVLFMVEGRSLVTQAARAMRRLGHPVLIEMADDRAFVDLSANSGPVIVVASVDSMVLRYKRYPRNFFRMIICDEVHHLLAGSGWDSKAGESQLGSYLEILKHFGVPVPLYGADGFLRRTEAEGDTLFCGLTATPDRGDGKNIMDAFDEVAFDYGIKQAIDDGWLVPVVQELCHLPGLDLSKVRKSAGDLDARQLEKVLKPLMEPICREVIKVADGRPTLVYNALKSLADATTLQLRALAKDRRIETVLGETPLEGCPRCEAQGRLGAPPLAGCRRCLFAAVETGEVWALSSVGTLTEGVDIPAATVAVMLRITSSRPLYAQILGRVLRPHVSLAESLGQMETAAQRRAAIAASPKPEAAVLDFAGNSGRHKLIRVIDVLGEREDEKAMNLARAAVERGAKDPMKALDDAYRALQEIASKAAGNEIERVLVDPFALFAVKGKRDAMGRPPTEAQIDALISCGAVEVRVSDPKSREKARKVILERFDLISASALLTESSRRIKAGEASMKQVRRLVRAGIPPDRVRKMTFGEAKAAITDLEAAGWTPTPAWIRKHSAASSSAAGAREAAP